VTIAPLHYLLNFRVVFTLIFAIFLSYARVDLLLARCNVRVQLPIRHNQFTTIVCGSNYGKISRITEVILRDLSIFWPKFGCRGNVP